MPSSTVPIMISSASFSATVRSALAEYEMRPKPLAIPAPKAESTITAATPIATPSMVRNVRVLRRHKFLKIMVDSIRWSWSSDRLANNRSQPLGRCAARVAQVYLVVLAAPLIALLRNKLVQSLDRRPFGSIGADI